MNTFWELYRASRSILTQHEFMYLLGQYLHNAIKWRWKHEMYFTTKLFITASNKFDFFVRKLLLSEETWCISVGCYLALYLCSVVHICAERFISYLLSKTFERLLLNRLQNMIAIEEIIPHHQFGFRHNNSTVPPNSSPNKGHPGRQEDVCVSVLRYSTSLRQSMASGIIIQIKVHRTQSNMYTCYSNNT
jgi:hypothetical protein